MFLWLLLLCLFVHFNLSLTKCLKKEGETKFNRHWSLSSWEWAQLKSVFASKSQVMWVWGWELIFRGETIWVAGDTITTRIRGQLRNSTVNLGTIECWHFSCRVPMKTRINNLDLNIFKMVEKWTKIIHLPFEHFHH